MSLNWSIREIHDYENLCWDTLTEPTEDYESLEAMVHAPQGWMAPTWDWTNDEKTEIRKLNSVTHALIFGSMAIGIGKITQANHEEVYLRYAMEEKIFGTRLRRKNEEGEWVDRSITLADIKRHIGLGTNVSLDSKAKYKNHLMRNLREAAERWLAAEKRKSAEEAA